jgi:hypothetical protein
MNGSSMAPIVIPIVVSFVLAVWIIIVFYAESHPLWKAHRPPGGQRAADPAAAKELPAAAGTDRDPPVADGRRAGLSRRRAGVSRRRAGVSRRRAGRGIPSGSAHGARHAP